ncbi:MAG: hypothetical protein RMN25_00640 [Anaerolineae bacterium]|nr:hypothetical protein [Thermoflexales bacterium]MDW8406262.1 hypothetical protein [Anaerolineae bacterium]
MSFPAPEPSMPNRQLDAVSPAELPLDQLSSVSEDEAQRELTAAAVRERVFMLAALIALTPLALLVVELPARSATLNFLGSPLSISLSTDSLLLVLVPVLACAGVDWILRDHPDARAGEVPYLFPFWIAPAFAALAIGLLLTRIPTWPLWIITLLMGTAMIATLIFAEYVSLSPNARGYAVARLALTGVSYAIAFALFTLVYSARERSIISATLTTLIAAGLALDLLAPHIVGLRTAAVFAGIIGLIVGQATWALNYWNISDWSAGILLLTVFYMLSGLAQQHFQDRLTRAVLLEFAIVAVVALIVAWQLAGVR